MNRISLRLLSAAWIAGVALRAQAWCPCSINTNFASFGAEGGSGVISLTTTGMCPWTVSVNADWVVVGSPNPPMPFYIPTWNNTNSLTHFNVLELTNPVSGYAYWAAQTTYPPVSLEKVAVVCSHDGINWEDPGVIHFIKVFKFVV